MDHFGSGPVCCKMSDRLVFGDSLADKKVGYTLCKIEQIANRDDPKWNQLNQIPNWRKCLSSLHSHEPLMIDSLRFKTPEHYYSYRKFSIADPSVAQKFVMDEKYGDIDGKDVRKGKKLILLSQEQWNKWESDVLPDAKVRAREAKFTNGSTCMKTLIATNDAELWSYAPRMKPFRMIHLEGFRESLINKQ